MKDYTINYSFTGPTGLTISGETTVQANDNSEARNLVAQQLRNKYAWPVRLQDVTWVKPKETV